MLLNRAHSLTLRSSGVVSLSRTRSLSNGNSVRASQAQVKHLNDLPSAKKFLGLVDLELLRYPPLKFHHFFGERATQFGNASMYVFQPFFYSPKILVVNTPALSREVVSKEGLMPERITAFEIIKEIRKKLKIKDGLIFSNGPEWKRLRDPTSKRLLRPKFVSQYIPEFSNLASAAANDIVSICQKGHTNHSAIRDRIMLLGAGSLNYFMFHKNLDNTDKTELNEYISALTYFIQNLSMRKWNHPRFKYLPSRDRNKLVESVSIMIKYTRQKMIEHRKIRSQGNEEIDFLQYLEGETDFDEVDILSIFVDFLGAAVDTTSVTTQWLWYNLAKSPRVQDKLYEEVSSVLGDSNVVTVEHFNKLHYMKMCLKESMRVTPSVGMFGRKIKQAGKIGGVEIPKDTIAIVDIHSIQLNEEYWKDAKEFIPERWEDRSEIDPFAYIPFGTGPRMCIGRRIAEAEIQLVTAHLCRRAKIHLEQEPDSIYEVLIYPKDLMLSFEKRSN